MCKKYTSLNGVIAVLNKIVTMFNLEGWVEIGIKSNNDDFNSLWTLAMLSRTTSQIEILELNIKDSEWLEIRYYNDGEYFNFMEEYHSLQMILSNIIMYVD